MTVPESAAAVFERGDCVFCRIVAGEAPAEIVTRWDDAIAFRPLGPVTDGHTLVVPIKHVENYATDPEVTAATMRRAAELAPHIHRQSNLITSAGPWATQTVFHLHVHIVPRRPNDGLHLPWTELDAQLATALAQPDTLGDGGVFERFPDAFDDRQRPVCGVWNPLLGPCVCGNPDGHTTQPSATSERDGGDE